MFRWCLVQPIQLFEIVAFCEPQTQPEGIQKPSGSSVYYMDRRTACMFWMFDNVIDTLLPPCTRPSSADVPSN
jgi:hypothetical protein